MTAFRLRNLGIAGVLAAGAAVLIGFYVTSYRNHVESGANLVSVFVAARDIPEDTEGSVLPGGYLKREKVLRRSVLAGAISSPDQVERLVVAQPILAGEQVSTRQFRPLVQQGVQAKLSGNMRGLVVPGEAHQLLAGKLETGDHVDVVANIKFRVKPKGTSSAGERSRVASRVVLRDLLVLDAPVAPSDEGIASGGDSLSVMLAVSDNQMQKLFFAMKNGDWSLALRPVAKPGDSPESVETIESVLGDGLKFNQLRQLTGGLGRESISSGQ
jgi:Flp pilus assembly protein CpaB